jgi:hypothetical protein
MSGTSGSFDVVVVGGSQAGLAVGHHLVGLTWQHTRGSALLGFVKDDAASIAGRIDAKHRAPTTGDP